MREKNKVTIRNLMAILKNDKNYGNHQQLAAGLHSDEGLTTKASRPADASTSSSVILWRAGIHPKNVSGNSGSREAASFCRFRAAYKLLHLGLRNWGTVLLAK